VRSLEGGLSANTAVRGPIRNFSGSFEIATMSARFVIAQNPGRAPSNANHFTGASRRSAAHASCG